MSDHTNVLMRLNTAVRECEKRQIIIECLGAEIVRLRGLLGLATPEESDEEEAR